MPQLQRLSPCSGQKKLQLPCKQPAMLRSHCLPATKNAFTFLTAALLLDRLRQSCEVTKTTNDRIRLNSRSESSYRSYAYAASAARCALRAN